MNSKRYAAMAAFAAATAVLVGAFLLPATVSVAYADSIKIQNNDHTGQGSKGSQIIEQNNEACTNTVLSTRGTFADQSNNCIVDQGNSGSQSSVTN